MRELLIAFLVSYSFFLVCVLRVLAGFLSLLAIGCAGFLNAIGDLYLSWRFKVDSEF